MAPPMDPAQSRHFDVFDRPSLPLVFVSPRCAGRTSTTKAALAKPDPVGP